MYCKAKGFVRNTMLLENIRKEMPIFSLRFFFLNFSVLISKASKPPVLNFAPKTDMLDATVPK
jgi:hypothetical protein